jgi:general secretion pathway protein G
VTPRAKRWSAFVGIAILLVLLAAVVLYKLEGGLYYDPAWNTEAGLSTLRTQLEIYKQMNGSYPTTEQGLHALVGIPTSSPIPEHWQKLVFEDTILDAWKRPFVYRFPSSKDSNSFDLFSLGRNGVESDDDMRNPP